MLVRHYRYDVQDSIFSCYVNGSCHSLQRPNAALAVNLKSCSYSLSLNSPYIVCSITILQIQHTKTPPSHRKLGKEEKCDWVMVIIHHHNRHLRTWANLHWLSIHNRHHADALHYPQKKMDLRSSALTNWLTRGAVFFFPYPYSSSWGEVEKFNVLQRTKKKIDTP